MGRTMKDELKVAMQVGSELRIKNSGEVVVDNPEIELAQDRRASDAVLSYRFDKTKGEHILRLLTPVADHRHQKEHHRGD
jgi:hypothetical protein